jgi:hyperosmotically inducible protein
VSFPRILPQKWPWLSLLLAAAALACSGSDAGRAGNHSAPVPLEEQFGEDDDISNRVQARLLDDPSVKAYGIEVTTRERVVYLTGSVETEAERARAVRLARETAGVKDVQSTLFVRQG